MYGTAYCVQLTATEMHNRRWKPINGATGLYCLKLQAVFASGPWIHFVRRAAGHGGRKWGIGADSEIPVWGTPSGVLGALSHGRCRLHPPKESRPRSRRHLMPDRQTSGPLFLQ